MIVKCNQLHYRYLHKRIITDGRGVRFYYRLKSHIPVILRTIEHDYHYLQQNEMIQRALFNLDGINYREAIKAGIPLPQSWKEQHIYQVSLIPLKHPQPPRKFLSIAIAHHIPGVWHMWQK